LSVVSACVLSAGNLCAQYESNAAFRSEMYSMMDELNEIMSGLPQQNTVPSSSGDLPYVSDYSNLPSAFDDPGIKSLERDIDNLRSDIDLIPEALSGDKKIENKEWSAAKSSYEKVVNESKSRDASYVKNCLTLSMICWNLDKTYDARKYAEKAISAMEDKIGGNCEERAEQYLKKLKSGDLPYLFSPKDFLASYGTLEYMSSPAFAQEAKNLARQNAVNDAIISYSNSKMKTLQAESERMARNAKRDAKEIYRSETGKNFDLTSRPVYSGKAQDEWDACKRIIDIFE